MWVTGFHKVVISLRRIAHRQPKIIVRSFPILSVIKHCWKKLNSGFNSAFFLKSSKSKFCFNAQKCIAHHKVLWRSRRFLQALILNCTFEENSRPHIYVKNAKIENSVANFDADVNTCKILICFCRIVNFF